MRITVPLLDLPIREALVKNPVEFALWVMVEVVVMSSRSSLKLPSVPICGKRGGVGDFSGALFNTEKPSKQ